MLNDARDMDSQYLVDGFQPISVAKSAIYPRKKDDGKFADFRKIRFLSMFLVETNPPS